MHDTLKSIFQTLSENAEENFIKNKNAEDYLAKDGLWHCGKCGTAKQFRLPERFMKMGMPEIVGCCCACQSAKENGRMQSNSLHLSSERIKKTQIFPNIICQLIWQFWNLLKPKESAGTISKTSRNWAESDFSSMAM